MGYNITYDKTGLTDAKKQLSEIATSLQTRVEEVIAAANRVNEGWTGANAELYIEKFNQYKPEMDKIVDYINKTVIAIGKTIQRFQDSEDEGRQAINNLPV